MASFFFSSKYYSRGRGLERKDGSQTLKVHSSSSCTACPVACSGRPPTDLDFCVRSQPAARILSSGGFQVRVLPLGRSPWRRRRWRSVGGREPRSPPVCPSAGRPLAAAGGCVRRRLGCLAARPVLCRRRLAELPFRKAPLTVP